MLANTRRALVGKRQNSVKMKGTLVLVFLSIVLKGVQPKIVIQPYPTTYAIEHTSLTLKCTITGTDLQNFNLIKWISDKPSEFPIRPGNCKPFGTPSDSTSYNYSCVDGMEFSFTVLNVSTSLHSKSWWCEVRQSRNISDKTKIFVKVPLKYVAFTNPAEDDIYVTENVTTQFQCTTSAERPRSTIQWYIEDKVGPLEGGVITSVDNDTLAPTIGRIDYIFNRNDNGSKFYCTAFNMDGENPISSDKKEIIVEYGTDGPPVIDGLPNGSTYSVMNSTQCSLTCDVTGGSPLPALVWNCSFEGFTTEQEIIQSGVRRTITWIASSSIGSSVCRCVSYQKISKEQSSSINIVVLYPPSVPVFYVDGAQVTDTVKYIQSRKLLLQCYSHGNPPPSYRWRRGFSEIETVSRNVEFEALQKRDSGNYTCITTNVMTPSFGNVQYGLKESSITLDVLYPPSTPTFRMQNVSVPSKIFVIANDEVVVTCESASNPAPSYKWTGQAYASNVLNIVQVQLNVTKTCNVTNIMTPSSGSSESSSRYGILNIVVMKTPTSPSLSFIPQSGSAIPLTKFTLAVIKGTNFSVACDGSIGYPEPSYSWPRVASDTADTINFINIGKPDGGLYICNVSNIMNRTVGDAVIGRNNVTLYVDILYPPEIEMVDNKTLQENDALILPCIASSNPQPSSYVWTRSKGSFLNASQNLIIQHVTRKDTDVYTCTVRNTMEPTVGVKAVTKESRISVTVRVFYFPDVSIYQPNGNDLLEGDVNITLMCTADGDPDNFTFKSWKHLAPDGTTLIREFTVFEYTKGQVQLTFLNASYMDSGFFECSVSNGIIDYQTNRKFAISRVSQRVKGHPIVTVDNSYVISELHGNATLTASYYSNDVNQKSVQWYRYTADTWQEITVNDRELVRNGSDTFLLSFYGVQFYQPGNVSQLVLANVSGKDFTLYRVEVINSIGTTFSSTIQLAPESAPEAPKKLAVLPGSTTSSSITVTWVSGFHGGDDQIFHVQYNTSTTPWIDGATVKGFKLINVMFNATIYQLSSETQYYFRIFADNFFGKSPYSDKIVTARTRSDAESPINSLSVGPIVGGAAGGAVLAAVIGVVMLYFRRRWKNYLKRPSKTLLKDNDRQPGNIEDDNTPEINFNPMYESAGPLPSASNNSDVYSQVDKNRKKRKPVGDIYSQVDKPRKRQNSGGSETKNDVYAQVQKKHLKKQDAGKTKHETQKPDKKKKKGKQTEGDLYDNVDPVRTTVTKGNTVYENPSCSIEEEHPKQPRNHDGLIYADLDLPKETVGKGRKAVIHGLDDRTDYADIKYGEVGEQAAESDNENIKTE